MTDSLDRPSVSFDVRSTAFEEGVDPLLSQSKRSYASNRRWPFLRWGRSRGKQRQLVDELSLQVLRQIPCRSVLRRLANREDASRGALRATSAAGTHQPVQRRVLRRRSLPARPARPSARAAATIVERLSTMLFQAKGVACAFSPPSYANVHRQRRSSAPIFSAWRPLDPIVLTFRRASLVLLLRRLPLPISSRARETAHVPAALLRLLPLRPKCVAIAGTWQLGRSPWQWLSRGWAAQPIPQQHSNTADAAGNGPKAAAGSGIPTQCATNSCPCSADASAARAGAGRRANPHICVLPCCSQILIRRSLHAGARGRYRCTTHLFRG